MDWNSDYLWPEGQRKLLGKAKGELSGMMKTFRVLMGTRAIRAFAFVKHQTLNTSDLCLLLHVN